MIFTPVEMGGVKVDAPFGGILLDVVQDYGLTSPDQMYGSYRKTGIISTARKDAWRRLEEAGMRRAEIARLFSVSKAAVTVASTRHDEGVGVCPCCGRAIMPALMRG